MIDPPLERDIGRLLGLLQEAPRTHTELVTTLQLSASRVQNLLVCLQKMGRIHSPRCVMGKRGRTVNLWELRRTEASPGSKI